MKAFTSRIRRSTQGRRDSGAPLSDPAGQGASARRTRRRRWATGLALAAPLALGGCSFYPTYGASRGATKQAQDTFKIYSGMTTTGIIVGGIVFLLIGYALVRYRRRSDEMPRQFQYNLPVEIVYTTIPILIVAVLFFFTVLTENNVDATVNSVATAAITTTGRPVVNIRVTAFQWGWRFDYAHYDVGVAGETTNGPDNHGPQMVVPVGQTVQITLVSADVIHGFYVRDFNFSRYALPGVTNVFDLNVIHAGTYNGQCTQICGLYHSEMLFSVRAVSPANFVRWAHAERRAGHTLTGSGVSAANIPPAGTQSTPSNALAPPSTAKAAA